MDSNVQSDWQDDFSGGVHAGISAKRLLPNQAHSAKNTAFRGGQPHPRLPVNLMIGSSDSNFLNGILQGWAYYNLPDHDYIALVIGGKIYLVEYLQNSVTVSDVTPSDGGNDPNIPICWLCQADKYLIIQDGQRVPIVVSDKISKRADGINPIPTGTVMAYGNGRLWVAFQNQLLAGDLIGSEEDAVLKFSEAVYLNEGGSFKLPASQGNVVSLDFIAYQDTATGQGTLVVGGEYGFSTINSLIPRDQWKSNPIQQITLIGIGSTGHRSTCNVNGDLWFRSHDGWRTYRQARAEAQGWSQVPLSAQVQQYIDNDTQPFLPYVSAVYFDNRLLVTSGPSASNNRTSNFGILSLDFHPLSTGFATSAGPAWDGYWELPGPVIGLLTGVFQGVKRCFAFCLVNNQNTIYEFTTGYADNGTDAISWELVTKKFMFTDPSKGMEKKLIQGGDFRVSNRIAATTATLSWRQDDSCEWKPWQTFSETGRVGQCSPTTVGGVCTLTSQPCQYTPRELLGEPLESFDSVTERDNSRFYDCQFKFNFTGYLCLESFRPQAIVVSDKDERGDPA